MTDLEVGNPAHNVIPAKASARLNIRFNPNWRAADLLEKLEAACRSAQEGFNGQVRLAPRISGEAFYTEPGPFVSVVAEAVREVTGAELPVVERERRPGDPPRLVAGAEKIRSELGWTPERDLTRMVQDAWTFAEAHPAGYAQSAGEIPDR